MKQKHVATMVYRCLESAPLASSVLAQLVPFELLSAHGISMRGKGRQGSAKAVSSMRSLKSLCPRKGTCWASHWGCVAMLLERFSAIWLFQWVFVLKASLKPLAVRPQSDHRQAYGTFVYHKPVAEGAFDLWLVLGCDRALAAVRSEDTMCSQHRFPLHSRQP